MEWLGGFPFFRVALLPNFAGIVNTELEKPVTDWSDSVRRGLNVLGVVEKGIGRGGKWTVNKL